MNWLTEPFRHEFMQRALFGCALIGFTNGVLSTFIVLRRLALMADAMAHSLLPGVAVAIILFGLAPGNLFFGGLVAALLVGLGVQIISGSSRIKEDTSLGLLFACSFALGLVLLSLSPSQVNVTHYLFGNILGLADGDLWIIYLISFIVLPLLVAFQRPLLLLMFEPSVAASQGVLVRPFTYMLMGLLVLSMISSLQAVGVVLALGMLIAPAATIYLCHVLGRRHDRHARLVRGFVRFVLAQSSVGRVHRSCPRRHLLCSLSVQPEIRRALEISPPPPSPRRIVGSVGKNEWQLVAPPRTNRKRDSRASEVSSKIVSDCSVETAALAELRRTDANAAAVPQFVDLIEEIHDVETDLKTSGDLRDFQIPLQRQIDRSVIGNAFGVGEAAPQSASVKEIA